MRYFILLLSVAALFQSTSLATIINIPDDYLTIQQGIDVSSDGDTVLVQPGTYVEIINYNGHNIVLGSLFLTTRDTSYISTTILDGDLDGPVVMLESGEDSTAAIIGFSIINGFTNSYGAAIKCMNNSNPLIRGNIISNNQALQGAGLYCSSSDPIVRNNYFYADTSWHDGGAIYCSSSAPKIIDNIFESNFGDCGAAICTGNSNALIEGNIMSDNYAVYRGGGIACLYGGEPQINNNTISDNIADWGGGLYTESSDIVFHNNIVVRNSAYGGGGLYIGRGDDSIISNNLLMGNLAFEYNNGRGFGGGLYCYSSDVTIINTIFWADSATNIGDEIYLNDDSAPVFNYCAIQGGWEGESNIDLDPLFRDPENGDFHLMSTECGDPYDSPCVDMGHPDSLDATLDCFLGLGTVRSDMGAYGGGAESQTNIDTRDIELPARFILSQNYPNPFNAVTIISYSLPEPSEVVIEIYDILGRKVETLAEGQQPAGQHQAIWDADDVSSGVYFYGIQAGDFSESRSCILLK
ncbi:MAG: right-handed parallel beta-helix repeat-containing protein [candidate division Zixibacteria bacterium]